MKAPEVLQMTWKKGDGLVPFHFANKPLGHRCAWTCRWLVAPYRRPGYDNNWQTGAVSIGLRDWGACVEPQHMSIEALQCELEDIAGGDTQWAGEAFKLLKSHFLKQDKIHWRVLVETFLIQARQLYPEFLSNTNPPTRGVVQKKNYRPGWDV